MLMQVWKCAYGAQLSSSSTRLVPRAKRAQYGGNRRQITSFAEKSWCLWHKDCTKADFYFDKLLDKVHLDCWVDQPSAPWPEDLTEVFPRERVLGAYHCNKNCLGNFCYQIHMKFPHQDDAIFSWIRKHKSSMRPPAHVRHQHPRKRPWNRVPDHCWRVSARFSVRPAVIFTFHADYEPTKEQKWKIDEGRSALEDLHNLEALVEDEDAPFDLTVPQLNKTFRFGIPPVASHHPADYLQHFSFFAEKPVCAFLTAYKAVVRVWFKAHRDAPDLSYYEVSCHDKLTSA